jgi:hypothetical protein
MVSLYRTGPPAGRYLLKDSPLTVAVLDMLVYDETDDLLAVFTLGHGI